MGCRRKAAVRPLVKFATGFRGNATYFPALLVRAGGAAEEPALPRPTEHGPCGSGFLSSRGSASLIPTSQPLTTGALAEGFRAHAEEIRARADNVHDPVVRLKMRQIAARYDRLAWRVEKEFGEADKVRGMSAWFGFLSTSRKKIRTAPT
jgi:hypothetical protein